MDPLPREGWAPPEVQARRGIAWLWIAVAVVGVAGGALLPALVLGVPPDMPCGDEPRPSEQELAAFERWAQIGLAAGLVATVASAIGLSGAVPHRPSVGLRWVALTAAGLGLLGVVVGFPVTLLAAGPMAAVVVLGPFAAGLLTARDRTFRILGYLACAELALIGFAGNHLWGEALC